VSRAAAGVDLWLREIAPTPALRQWFDHQPARWTAFRARYFAELDTLPASVATLRAAAAGQARLTLLYAARDERHNHARALRDYLLAHPAG